MNESFHQLLNRCVRCGKCRSVCPVFEQTLIESDSARGRLFAVGQLDSHPTPLYLSFLSKCLLCGACEAECSSGVPVTELIRKARSHHHMNLVKRFAFENLLTEPRRLKTASKAGRALLKILSRRVPDDSGLRFRYGVAKWIGERRFPPIPPRDLFSEFGTQSVSSDTAIFAGCTFGYLMPEVGRAAISLLQKTGVRSDVPAGQSCCGLMAYGSGDEKGAFRALKNFFQVFEKYDRILVLCASCLTMLKKFGPELIPEAANFFNKVCDVHSFLLEAGYSPEGNLDDAYFPLAYHAPCHLRFALKDDSPKRLLEVAGGIELAPLPDSCCGFGGSFSFSHTELSTRIGSKRASQVRQSGLRTIATSCAGCLLGLYDAAQSIRPAPEIVHPLCLLAKKN